MWCPADTIIFRTCVCRLCRFFLSLSVISPQSALDNIQIRPVFTFVALALKLHSERLTLVTSSGSHCFISYSYISIVWYLPHRHSLHQTSTTPCECRVIVLFHTRCGEFHCFVWVSVDCVVSGLSLGSEGSDEVLRVYLNRLQVSQWLSLSCVCVSFNLGASPAHRWIFLIILRPFLLHRAEIFQSECFVQK